MSISYWSITTRKNNEVLRKLQDVLYALWKDYDCVLDYYIFPLFFAMISKEYPESATPMSYAKNQNILMLHHWGDKFEQY